MPFGRVRNASASLASPLSPRSCTGYFTQAYDSPVLYVYTLAPYTLYKKSQFGRVFGLCSSLFLSPSYSYSLLSPFYFLPPLSLLSAVVRANASFEYMHTCLRVYVCTRDAYHLIPSCGSRHSPHARWRHAGRRGVDNEMARVFPGTLDR